MYFAIRIIITNRLYLPDKVLLQGKVCGDGGAYEAGGSIDAVDVDPIARGQYEGGVTSPAPHIQHLLPLLQI